MLICLTSKEKLTYVMIIYFHTSLVFGTFWTGVSPILHACQLKLFMNLDLCDWPELCPWDSRPTAVLSELSSDNKSRSNYFSENFLHSCVDGCYCSSNKSSRSYSSGFWEEFLSGPPLLLRDFTLSAWNVVDLLRKQN